MSQNRHSFFTTNSKKPIPDNIKALISSPEKIEEAVVWAKSTNYSNYTFRSKHLIMDASPETLFNIAKDVSQCADISNGALTVEMNGELIAENTVTLQL